MGRGNNIGVLYSIETGIVLRHINFSEYSHQQHLKNNLPEGTALILMDKKKFGANNYNTPNLDILIAYIKKRYNKELRYGDRCVVVDDKDTVVEVICACPKLYQKKLDIDVVNKKGFLKTIYAEKYAIKGNKYDKIKKKFYDKNRPEWNLKSKPTTALFPKSGVI